MRGSAHVFKVYGHTWSWACNRCTAWGYRAAQREAFRAAEHHLRENHRTWLFLARTFRWGAA